MKFAALILLVAAGINAGGAMLAQTRPGDWYLDDARVPRHMPLHAGQKPVVVAIVDDAVRITHRDLVPFIWTNPKEIAGNRIDDDGNGHVDDVHGWDVSDDDGDVGPPADRAELYHGTHLAGIIATIARTAYGAAAPDLVRIMPVKAIADLSQTTYLANAYAGIEYAVAAGADIVLCAWSVGQITPRESAILQDAADRGVLVIGSAGNFPEERDEFPAAHANVMAVGAIDERGQKPANANFGEFIDISAPGVAIRGASSASDDGEEVHDGTSAASAITAAAAALVKIEHAAFSPKAIEACIMSGSTAIEPPGREHVAKLGAGRLNVEAAIACRVLVDVTPSANRLVHTKGFLHATTTSATSITWTIEPRGEFSGIRFRPAFRPDRSLRGRLEFRTDASAAARVVENVTLDAFPASVYVAGPTAFVTFTPDRGAPPADVLVEYAVAAIDFRTLYCRGTKEIRDEGMLTDGSGPENYSPRTDCKWHIVAPPGKVIRFLVDEFDTEAKTDFVYFFNGSTTRQDQLMAFFSGPSTTPRELITWTNDALVWFVTDGKNQARGWSMTYRFQDR